MTEKKSLNRWHAKTPAQGILKHALQFTFHKQRTKQKQ